jgi:hypothetical protein
MADDKTIFELDVDNENFLAGINESKDSLADLGGADNLSGLLDGLMGAGAAVAALGVAAFAVKEAFDLVFNAEQIKAVNQQFEMLSTNAGITADTLKSGLVEAGGGMATDTELLQAANKALVEMGVSAKQLPETLTLARQVTAVFGGDLIQNFEGINQAIASGNVRLLKHMGIIVDQKKAYDDFAKSIGTSADMLSKQGQQQALMNAVLAAGAKEFKGVDLNVKEATNTWKVFKTTMAEIGEATAVIFNTVFGKIVIGMLHAASEAAKVFLGLSKQIFGTETEKQDIKYKGLQAEFEQRSKNIQFIEEKRRKEANLSEDLIRQAYNKSKAEYLAGLDSEIAKQQEKITSLKTQMDTLKPGGNRGPASDEAAGEASKNNAIFIDQQKSLEKRKEAVKEFEDELESMREQRVQREDQTNTTIEQVEKTHKTHLETAELEFAAKKKALQEQIDAAGKQGTAQADEVMVELENQKAQRIKEINDRLEADKIAALTREKEAARSASAGIAAAFKQGAEQARGDLNNFGKTGQSVFDSFRKNSKQALLDFGSGAKSAGDAAKEFLLGTIADQAEGQGELLLLSSIWPPNPLGLAAGAGLIALAGALRAAAGGGSSGFGAVGAGGAAPGGGSTSQPLGGGAPGAPQANTNPAQAMTVNFQGPVFDTDATRTRLMELMRQAQDMQQFNLNQIGPA